MSKRTFVVNVEVYIPHYTTKEVIDAEYDIIAQDFEILGQLFDFEEPQKFYFSEERLITAAIHHHFRMTLRRECDHASDYHYYASVFQGTCGILRNEYKNKGFSIVCVFYS